MNLAESRDPDYQRETENEDAPLNALNVKKSQRRRNNNNNQDKYNVNKFLIILFIIVFLLFVFSIYQLIISLNEFNDKPKTKKISNLKKTNNNKNISSETTIININNKINLTNNIDNLKKEKKKEKEKEKENNNTIIESGPILKINVNNITNNNKDKKALENKNLTKINVDNKTNLNNTQDEYYDEKKISVAFIYHLLHSNGVARVIALTASHLVNTGKYNVYIITGKETDKDYSFDKRIKRFIGHEDRNLIKDLKQKYNIKFFILNNQLTESIIRFLQSLDSKVIGIFHGVYLSAIFHNNTSTYRSWYKFDVYNSFIVIAPDDLYFYKKLGYKYGTFIPNLYTYEPNETPVSKLSNHNIVMLGRANDKIKGTIYAINTLKYIVKEVPDVNLIIGTSDTYVNYLENYAKNLNIRNNIIFKFFPNITQLFLNASVLMFTSLCEAFPMAMNEGKAFGLPIVAFNIPFSLPFQSGVITVPHFDCKALANETIKLLKDYDYRKKKGEEAKLSLNKFNNNDTINLWGKLFDSLENGEYRKFQKEIEDKYYNEEIAKKHVLAHFNTAVGYNKYFRCHKFENMLNMTYIKNIESCPNVTRLL